MTFDTQDKIIWSLFGIFFLILIIYVFFGINRLNEKTDWCREKGGTIVKSIDGWKCIDAKEMK